MCGILALIRPSDHPPAPTAPIRAGTGAARHRGPDDEGYLLWTREGGACLYAGIETARASRDAHRLGALPPTAGWQVAFGHRRLSIVDLSPGGFQPMIHPPTGLTIAFNGEIYNHVELREELVSLGHTFRSHSDTEVLLSAWAEWGPECLHRLNGMFAFVLLDPRDGGTVHAVRDRFGVKPLYYARVGDLLAFASEIKQIRALPGFRPRLDHSTARDYLAAGLLDHSRFTFDEGIKQLLGGERAILRLADADPELILIRWYTLTAKPSLGTADDLARAFRDLLTDSVRLRLRADVPVGSCLSGGLDSSAIVCIAHRLLREQASAAGQVTVTARFAEGRYDEWRFAEDVIRATDVRAVQVWPSVECLHSELDQQIWHMDEPFGSTSQFSQWCVFQGAAQAGLKVMLDGQGSDEQLAGYAGNETALYAGLLRRASILRLMREVVAFRHQHGTLPIAQLILAARNVAPVLDAVLPERLRRAAPSPPWLRLDAPSHLEPWSPRDLNESLARQTLCTSLPVLLRYEDRNSMARSIEARVPFLDYRLVELLAGVPAHLKLRGGITKVLLRDALADILPPSVRDRRDKMGFVTPEQLWLTRTDTEWFRSAIAEAVEAAPGIFAPDAVGRLVDDMVRGAAPFSFIPWRILCFGRWVARVHGA
jgi:asparagine synthase (glutamine-hydrolysing)